MGEDIRIKGKTTINNKAHVVLIAIKWDILQRIVPKREGKGK